jgi:hypothetical protein
METIAKTIAKRAGRTMLIAALALAPGAKALAECADYVSSGAGDQPLTGTLVGSRTVTQSTSQTFTGSFNTKLSGGSYQYQRSTTTTYEVGTYLMSDGTTQQIRCDTYTYV